MLKLGLPPLHFVRAYMGIEEVSHLAQFVICSHAFSPLFSV